MEHWLRRTSIITVFIRARSINFFHLIDTLYQSDQVFGHVKDNGSFYLRKHHSRLLGCVPVAAKFKSSYFLFVDFHWWSQTLYLCKRELRQSENRPLNLYTEDPALFTFMLCGLQAQIRNFSIFFQECCLEGIFCRLETALSSTKSYSLDKVMIFLHFFSQLNLEKCRQSFWFDRRTQDLVLSLFCTNPKVT